MGTTRDTGYLQNLVTYDASGNIVLPANLTVNGNLLVATQSYVTTQINNLINGAPALLDTLDELAAALGDDANFASTITTSIAGKQTQLNGTGFVKVTGTTVSYDNSTYLTTGTAASTYLPLIGGTITGALNGTGASFTGAFELNTAGTGALGFFGANNTTDKYIRIRNSNGNIEMGTSSTEHYVLGNGSIPLKFYTNGSPRLTLDASTGAATFASDVNIGGYFLTGLDKGIKFDTSGGSGHPEISVDSNVVLNFKNTAGTVNLSITNAGPSTFRGDVTVHSDLGTSVLNIGGANGDYASAIKLIGNNTFKNWEIGSNTGVQGSLEIRSSTVAGGTSFTTPVFSLSSTGGATFSSSLITGGNINVNSDGIFINRSSSGEPYIFFQKNSVNRGAIYGVTGGGLRVFDESDNQVLTITGTKLGINDPIPSRKLTVNFGTSVNDGLIVYGFQRQNTVFQSTGEHCFIYIDSFHNNTFLPVLHLQRSSTTFGTVGLQRASNSDGIGAYAESEMVVGTSTTVPFSIQTNSQRRIRVASGGGVEVFNTLSVSGNLTARNFSKFIKTWAPAGSTGSGTSTTYNWADELASVAGNFDSGGYYRGFIRSGNGAHYYGYHFDILVGSIGYGGNSLQFKVQNIVGANSPWAGGCGFPPFGTVDTTNFTHVNNPCGEYLELYITKLGG